MPGIILESSSSASSSSNGSGWTENNNGFVADDEYPAIDFQGYAEKPLSEQLTPIAVVGMGKSNLLHITEIACTDFLNQDADFLEMSHLQLNSGI
jgi:hypothetical protein